MQLFSSHRFLWSLCFVSTVSFASSFNAYGGGNSFGSYGGGGSSGGSGSGGGGGMSSGYGGGETKGPITAAVETHRSVEVKPVQMSNEPHEPQVIEVPSDDMPVVVHFKSQSSRVLVQQTHTPAQISEPEHTSSEDEPQRVIHEVVKPVVQEIREVIQPYRRLIQQIQPVIEQTHTVIAKGEPRPAVAPLSISGASSGSNGAGSSGSNGMHSSSGGGGKFGGSSGGYGNSGGNYAASASSTQISLKPAPTSSGSSHESMQSFRNTQTSTHFAPSMSSSASSSSGPSSAGRKFPSMQQIFGQESSPSSQYSSRRGDFREPQVATKTKITLRPAGPIVASMQAYQYPIISALQHYAFSDYRGQVSALHDEDIPLMTFVAQPIRFRARARA